GRRLHDLAHCALVFVPLDPPADMPKVGRVRLDPFARLRLLADAYGLAPDRSELVEIMGRRIAGGSDFVQRRVAAGDPAFTKLWSNKGYRGRYKARQRWF